MNGGAVRGVGAWGLIFVLVILQTTTTLRPLIGPFDGVLLGERMFFLAHWIASLG
jgi:hypothetical protein